MIRYVLFAVCVTQLTAQTIDSGKEQYLARCSGCHGEDGSGGGHGPAIVNIRQVRDVILKGIPGAGMPAFQLSDGETNAIAAYVIALKTPVTADSTPPPGDPAAGERFFAAKGSCAS